ncbi:uncharacterized protein LOC105850705 isoform X3 [Hydra vulgaris]|uniref:uncharacterized protein LOC105850705 isoform X3 n=1 Tax=Hydra vulgaris TaxID=6087 RepID=UPI0032EA81B1
MVKCHVCSGDASLSGTICALCNKIIDIQCHGGTIGDGYVVCKVCAGCCKVSPTKKDYIIGIQKMTKEKIEEIASSHLLKSIFSGQVYSYRHNLFYSGKESKRNLCDQELIDILNEDQQHNLYSALARSYNSIKHNEYVFKVLVPEAIIYLFAKVEGMSRIQAEVLIMTYISDRNQELSEGDEFDKSSDCGKSFTENVIERLKRSQIAKHERLQRWSNQETVSVKKECVTVEKEDKNFIITELVSELVTRVCIELDEEIHFDIEVNADIDKGPISRKENVMSVKNKHEVCSVLDESICCEVEEYKVIHVDNKDEVCSVLDESICCEVEEYKVIHVDNKDEVCSVLDESIRCEVEEYKVIHVDNKDEVCSVLDESICCEVEEYKVIHVDNKDEVCSVLVKSIRCEVEEYKVMHVDNKDEGKLSETKALNRSLDGMELNEHLSDMTKVYKRFGKKFSQKNKELNNDIHSRVAMNENEQMKMGSMLTGFMKVGLVSEAEKLFQQWKSNIKSEKCNDSKESKKYVRQKVRCTEEDCDAYIIDLPRHLRNIHNIDPETARKARGFFDLRKTRSVDEGEKSKNKTKYRCPICSIATKNIHDHLYRSPHYLKNNLPKYREMLSKKQLYIESKQFTVSLSQTKKQSELIDIKSALPNSTRSGLMKTLPNEVCFKSSCLPNERNSNPCIDALNADEYICNDFDETNNTIEKGENNHICFQDYLHTFLLYLKSPSGGKKDPQAALNEMHQIRRIVEVISPNSLMLHNLTTICYTSLLHLKLLQEKWFPYAKQKGYEPGTQRSYLLSLSHFINFLLRSKLTPTVPNVVPCILTADVLNVCQKEISNWRTSLRGEEALREYDVMMEDAENIIPKESFQAIIKSDFYQEIVKNVNFIYINYKNRPSEFLVTRTLFTNIRDCIFFGLITNNISRSGAVSSMTTAEFRKGSFSPTGSFIILVKKHKTAKQYGPCQIILNHDLKFMCDCYDQIIRSAIPGKMSENFFITWSGCAFESGGVSTQLNSFFLKCLPNEDSTEKRCSATMIRKSLLTYFYDNHPEFKSKLATLMKHKKTTAKRWYYLNKNKQDSCEESEKVTETLFGDIKVSTGNIKESKSQSLFLQTDIEKKVLNSAENPELSPLLFSEPSESESDEEYNFQPTSYSIQPKKSWTTDEINELHKLFNISDTLRLTQPLIRQVVAENEILKFRSSKQIYDKLLHLRKCKVGVLNQNEDQCLKVSFNSEQLKMIKKLFFSTISGHNSVTQANVTNVINQNNEAKELFKCFTAEQIVAKVRYEKKKLLYRKL